MKCCLTVTAILHLPCKQLFWTSLACVYICTIQTSTLNHLAGQTTKSMGVMTIFRYNDNFATLSLHRFYNNSI